MKPFFFVSCLILVKSSTSFWNIFWYKAQNENSSGNLLMDKKGLTLDDVKLKLTPPSMCFIFKNSDKSKSAKEWLFLQKAQRYGKKWCLRSNALKKISFAIFSSNKNSFKLKLAKWTFEEFFFFSFQLFKKIWKEKYLAAKI